MPPAGGGFHGRKLGDQHGNWADARVVAGRAGRPKAPDGPLHHVQSIWPLLHDDDIQVWLGGTFWDGRTPDTAGQARMPFLDANEMANTAAGPYPPHSGGYGPLVASKLRQALIETVPGGLRPRGLARLPTPISTPWPPRAIAAFEASGRRESIQLEVRLFESGDATQE